MKVYRNYSNSNNNINGNDNDNLGYLYPPTQFKGPKRKSTTLLCLSAFIFLGRVE